MYNYIATMITENIDFSTYKLIFLLLTKVKKNVTQSRTGLQIYEGRDDQLNRPGPMARKNYKKHGNLTLPFERACIFMSETMFTICGFFQYGGLMK
jgi:hypothetical protein